jgi:hypothetical protein
MLFQLLPINLLAFQSGTSQTDLVAGDWIAAFAQAMPEGLVLLTHHCYADGPAGAPHVFLPKLLQSARHLSPLLERLAQYSHRYHLPFRIVETNCIYDEGQQGVSDTLGAALWGLELMFQAAAAGAAGINFHGGIHSPRASDDKAYTPIARMGTRYRAAPLYYGMLMFAQAAPGSLIPAQLAPDTSGLKAFAVRAPDETLCVCLINQNITRDERVAIDSGRSFTAASVLRLAGPAIDATGGVTLGGASVDEFGGWAQPRFWRATARYGFMERPDIPALLETARAGGCGPLDRMLAVFTADQVREIPLGPMPRPKAARFGHSAAPAGVAGA